MSEVAVDRRVARAEFGVRGRWVESRPAADAEGVGAADADAHALVREQAVGSDGIARRLGAPGRRAGEVAQRALAPMNQLLGPLICPSTTPFTSQTFGTTAALMSAWRC